MCGNGRAVCDAEDVHLRVIIKRAFYSGSHVHYDYVGWLFVCVYLCV